MTLLSLYTTTDIQQQFAETIQRKRKQKKWSRRELAERSTVPESTLKRFETTGEISLRQFLLLWQSLDRLDRLAELAKDEPSTPKTIDEVLAT